MTSDNNNRINGGFGRASALVGVLIAVLFHFGWIVWFSASMNAKVSFLLDQSSTMNSEMQRRNTLLMEIMAENRALAVRIDGLERIQKDTHPAK